METKVMNTKGSIKTNITPDVERRSKEEEWKEFLIG